MKKCILMILLFVVVIENAFSDPKTPIEHIYHVIDENIVIDADIGFPLDVSCPTIRVERPNHITSDEMNVDIATGIFFIDQDSQQERTEFESELATIKNESGEWVTAYSSGSIRYHIHPINYMRYTWSLEELIDHLDVFGGTQFGYTKEDLSTEHDYMSIEEAHQLVRGYLSHFNLDIEPELYEVLCVTHDQLDDVAEQVKNEDEEDFFRMIGNGDGLYVTDWNEGDDVYQLKYQFSINTVPINRGDGQYTSYEGAPYNPILPMGVTARINRSHGLFYFDIDYANLIETIGEENLIGSENVIGILTDYFDEIILTNDITITDGYIEYQMIYDGVNLDRLVLKPILCIEMLEKYQQSGREYKRTIRFDAITGSEVT